MFDNRWASFRNDRRQKSASISDRSHSLFTSAARSVASLAAALLDSLSCHTDYTSGCKTSTLFFTQYWIFCTRSWREKFPTEMWVKIYRRLQFKLQWCTEAKIDKVNSGCHCRGSKKTGLCFKVHKDILYKIEWTSFCPFSFAKKWTFRETSSISESHIKLVAINMTWWTMQMCRITWPLCVHANWKNDYVSHLTWIVRFWTATLQDFFPCW